MEVSKNFVFVFLKKDTKINKKLDSLFRIWDKYSKVFERFLKFQAATTKKWNFFSKSLDGHCMFFRQYSDNFYRLLKFIDHFPKVFDFVTIKFRWHSKILGRFPQFFLTFFSKFWKANPNTNKQKYRRSL